MSRSKQGQFCTEKCCHIKKCDLCNNSISLEIPHICIYVIKTIYLNIYLSSNIMAKIK